MENNVIRGCVHKFGDNINTDLISPAQYMEMSDKVIAEHVMEGSDPGFIKKMKAGDIVVAGKNFGSGSSRETAPLALKNAGVSVVISEFFARIFYRNSINIGLPVLTTSSTSNIKEGDELEVDLMNGTINNITRNEVYFCTALPEHIMEIIKDGGLINHLKKKGEIGKNE